VPRPRLVRSLLLAGIVTASLAVTPTFARAALLDANCPGPSSSSVSFGTDSRRAQTFTALHTGIVIRAETEITKGQDGNNFQLQILATNALGTPLNGILGAATIPNASVPLGPSTLSGTFQTPASVVAGQQYALVVTRPGDDGFTLRDRIGNPCPGQEFASNTSIDAFNPDDPAYDFVYQVFVNPPNDFTAGQSGKRRLIVHVPGAGQISVFQGATGGPPAIESKSKKLLKSSQATATGAGDVTIPLRPTKRGKALLKVKRKFKVAATVTFTPTGGEPGTQGLTLKIK
jgi:hypothetical protein